MIAFVRLFVVDVLLRASKTSFRKIPVVLSFQLTCPALSTISIVDESYALSIPCLARPACGCLAWEGQNSCPDFYFEL